MEDIKEKHHRLGLKLASEMQYIEAAIQQVKNLIRWEHSCGSAERDRLLQLESEEHKREVQEKLGAWKPYPPPCKFVQDEFEARLDKKLLIDYITAMSVQYSCNWGVNNDKDRTQFVDFRAFLLSEIEIKKALCKKLIDEITGCNFDNVYVIREQ